MRVTNKMLVDNLSNNLSSNLEKLNMFQDRLSTGKRINKPSDDPIGMKNILQQRTNLGETDQYSTNVDSAQLWLQENETAVSSAETIIVRIKELATAGANGTLNSGDRKVMAAEVDDLFKELIRIGNSNINGEYIFSGQMTHTPSYDTNGNYKGDTETISRQIGNNTYLEINLSGEEVFNANGIDAFQTVKNLKTALEDND
ncbi:flagellar hook-associated protein FlgL, partial [Candidatus Desantisbacteria bacterium]|nr:flagellar hook-associated protein FlgL [Candidatus Desantisbacteria bacterium]